MAKETKWWPICHTFSKKNPLYLAKKQLNLEETIYETA
jgi:hypothetical protein